MAIVDLANMTEVIEIMGVSSRRMAAWRYHSSRRFFP